MTSATSPLREARQRAGLSQSELARRLGTSQVAIWRYEAGVREPKVVQAQRIAAVLGTTVEKLWPAKKEVRA